MRDGTATRELFCTEALRLFVERGVDAVSVGDIADAVGRRKSTLYVHWTSKEALIHELFTSGYAEYGRRLRAVLDTPGAFTERLAALVRLICCLHDEDTTRFKFLLLTQHGHLARVALDADNPVEALDRALQAAMDAGEIPARNTALTTAAVIGIVLQAATFRTYGRITQPLGELADDIVALCLKVVQ